LSKQKWLNSLSCKVLVW